MMLGMLGIMGTLVWKLIQSPSINSGQIYTGEIDVPVGHEIVTVSRSGASLFVVLKNDVTGDFLLEERSVETQALIGQFSLKEAKE